MGAESVQGELEERLYRGQEGRVLQQQLNTSPWTDTAAALGVDREGRSGRGRTEWAECPRGGVPQGLMWHGEVSPLLQWGTTDWLTLTPKVLKMATAIGQQLPALIKSPQSAS